MDVAVKRGAVCNTDHSLLWRIGKKFSRHGSKDRLVKRFDVAKLQGACEDRQGRELPKGKFVSAVSDAMERNCDQAATVQEKWKVLRDAMCSAARSKLGQGGRREPDWFRDSESVLRPLFERRRQLFSQWLCSRKMRDKRKFVEARRVARRTVRTNGSRPR